MRRRLFTFASVPSLLLCVATAVLWVRSYRAADYVAYVHVSGGFEHIIASHGDLIVYDARSNEGNTQPGFRHAPGKPLSLWSKVETARDLSKEPAS